MKGRKPTQWTSAAARRLLQLAGNVPSIGEAVVAVCRRYLEGIDGPPTDLESLSRRLNVSSVVAEPLPISGELRRERDGFVIAYSRFLSPAKRRFTIAHEIAHAIFESSGPNCPRVGRELERLCDMIATELLMPRATFLLHAPALHDFSLSAVDRLSKLFGTSLSATSLRGAELLGLTFFEVNGTEIAWACGAISKGPLAKLADDLKSAIASAKRRESFDDHLYISTESTRHAWWKLESRRVGQGDRRYFMLKPLGRDFDESKLLPRAGDFLF